MGSFTLKFLFQQFSFIFIAAKLFHQVIWERTEHKASHPYFIWWLIWNFESPHLSNCEMFTFSDVLHETKQRKELSRVCSTDRKSSLTSTCHWMRCFVISRIIKDELKTVWVWAKNITRTRTVMCARSTNDQITRMTNFPYKTRLQGPVVAVSIFFDWIFSFEENKHNDA